MSANNVKRYRYERDYDYGWSFDESPVLGDKPIEMVIASDYDSLAASHAELVEALLEAEDYIDHYCEVFIGAPELLTKIASTLTRANQLLADKQEG